MTIRVRFAPSPTGFLHIGGARTALFNWLFARKSGGKFILRIEDTDEARSTDESVNAILDSMKWLGLDWDEGPGKEKPEHAPYFQMQAHEKGIYKQYSDKLVANGKAYKCFCTPEEVEEMRKTAQAEKKVPKYDGRCRNLTDEQRKQKEAEGRKSVVRLKVSEEGKTVFDDVIRGRVEFENNMLDDFVIIKNTGGPTYNFAVVVDDVRMKISHIIRGDDHLSNTPKQIHLYKALGWETPVFAHLSMILGSDGARLSKRHGHTSVLEYRQDGYLPEAIVNYLALLGWSTEDSQQLFTKEEMIEKFSLERCSVSPAMFDPQKLVWMNGEYIRKKSAEELIRIYMNWLKETGREDEIKNWDKTLLNKAIAMEQEKVKLLKDVNGRIDFFFVDEVKYNADAAIKVFKAPTAKSVLEESILRLEKSSDFSSAFLEKFARDFAAEKGLKTGQVFHPLRVAVSGRTEGPSLFHMMELLGREETIKRIKTCLTKCFSET